VFLSFQFGLLGSHSSKSWAGEMKNTFIQQHRTTTVKVFYKKPLAEVGAWLQRVK